MREEEEDTREIEEVQWIKERGKIIIKELIKIKAWI
jgi:hypothetical protein